MNIEIKFPIILLCKYGTAYISNLETLESGCNWDDHTRVGYKILDSNLIEYEITSETFKEYIGKWPKFLVRKSRRTYKIDIRLDNGLPLNLEDAKELMIYYLRKDKRQAFSEMKKNILEASSTAELLNEYKYF